MFTSTSNYGPASERLVEIGGRNFSADERTWYWQLGFKVINEVPVEIALRASTHRYRSAVNIVHQSDIHTELVNTTYARVTFAEHALNR